MNNSIPFGWNILIELYNQNENCPNTGTNADTCPVNEKAVYQDRQVSMNVSVTLKAFHDNTLATLKRTNNKMNY